MKAHLAHEKLRAYQDALPFGAWVSPCIADLPATLAAKDPPDRASTSVVRHLAEGNGKRSHPDRCRYVDIARGSGVEGAACLDVRVVKNRMAAADAAVGKEKRLGMVSMVAGLIARLPVKFTRSRRAARAAERKRRETKRTGTIKRNENDF